MENVVKTPFGSIDTAAMDAAAAGAEEVRKRPEREEVTIKFARGLASEPFMSKAGKELVRIQIPNQDPEDHSPWAEFVLPAKSVHENQYGKGLWAKIPADGVTTVSKPFLEGVDADGKAKWNADKRSVPNRELKEMVEFYKTAGRDERTAAPADRKTQEKTAGDLVKKNRKPAKKHNDMER